MAGRRHAPLLAELEAYSDPALRQAEVIAKLADACHNCRAGDALLPHLALWRRALQGRDKSAVLLHALQRRLGYALMRMLDVVAASDSIRTLARLLWLACQLAATRSGRSQLLGRQARRPLAALLVDAVALLQRTVMRGLLLQERPVAAAAAAEEELEEADGRPAGACRLAEWRAPAWLVPCAQHVLDAAEATALTTASSYEAAASCLLLAHALCYRLRGKWGEDWLLAPSIMHLLDKALQLRATQLIFRCCAFLDGNDHLLLHCSTAAHADSICHVLREHAQDGLAAPLVQAACGAMVSVLRGTAGRAGDGLPADSDTVTLLPPLLLACLTRLPAGASREPACLAIVAELAASLADSCGAACLQHVTHALLEVTSDLRFPDSAIDCDGRCAASCDRHVAQLRLVMAVADMLSQSRRVPMLIAQPGGADEPIMEMGVDVSDSTTRLHRIVSSWLRIVHSYLAPKQQRMALSAEEKATLFETLWAVRRICRDRCAKLRRLWRGAQDSLVNAAINALYDSAVPLHLLASIANTCRILRPNDAADRRLRACLLQQLHRICVEGKLDWPHLPVLVAALSDRRPQPTADVLAECKQLIQLACAAPLDGVALSTCAALRRLAEFAPETDDNYRSLPSGKDVMRVIHRALRMDAQGAVHFAVSALWETFNSWPSLRLPRGRCADFAALLAARLLRDGETRCCDVIVMLCARTDCGAAVVAALPAAFFPLLLSSLRAGDWGISRRGLSRTVFAQGLLAMMSSRQQDMAQPLLADGMEAALYARTAFDAPSLLMMLLYWQLPARAGDSSRRRSGSSRHRSSKLRHASTLAWAVLSALPAVTAGQGEQVVALLSLLVAVQRRQVVLLLLLLLLFAASVIVSVFGIVHVLR